MIHVILYNRKDCHLCDQAIEDLDALSSEIPHELEMVDIDDNQDLVKKYGEKVPVIEVGPYRLVAPFSRQELQVTLGAAQHGFQQDRSIDQAISSGAALEGLSWTKTDRFNYWLSRHYLAILSIGVFIYVSIPFLAPVLMKAGLTGPASVIYKVYGVACHQLAYRSWFLFGEQAAYPRQAAGLDRYISFEQATGMDSTDYFAAREFVGNDAMGYKMALCERDIAIYLSILLFGIIYGLTGKRLPALPAVVWILVWILPIAIDGLSQLLSQPPFSMFPYRESTPFLRSLTGFLFGFMTAWFAYPIVEASMAETRRYMSIKFERLKRNPAPDLRN